MCGIFGYLGQQKATGILLEGLKRLEYRGYDSAGLATQHQGALQVTRRVGRVKELASAVHRQPSHAKLGICHTRWATHGGVTEENAHPHLSCDGKIAVVHNGVIENYTNIKKFLEAKDYTFSSQTDTEVLTNLVAYHYEKEPNNEETSRLFESVRKALRHVEGTYGIAVICEDCPNEIIGARHGSPLILGVGRKEILLASDVAAMVSRTAKVVYLNDGEIVHIRHGDFQFPPWTRRISYQSSTRWTGMYQRVNWAISNITC